MVEQTSPIGIVGAGVVGLSCALLLSEAGYNVTIMARDLPGDMGTAWSSPWAAALLAAHPDGDAAMQKRSLEFYKTLSKTGQPIGLQELPITEYYDDRDESSIWYADLFPDLKFLKSGSLPISARIGFSYTCQAVNPTIFLSWLASELNKRGVKSIRQNVESFEQARALSHAQIIVNASGLGAAKLAGDDKVYPVRGQTMFVKADFNRAVLFQGSSYTYAIQRPGSGGVILGGVSQPHNTSTEIDPNIRVDILRRVNLLTDGSFSWLDLERDEIMDIVGFRPFRQGGMRVEQEGNTIHAYGAGGLGYLYCFGIAEKVRDMVSEALQQN